jgi:hypothetical protein
MRPKRTIAPGAGEAGLARLKPEASIRADRLG